MSYADKKNQIYFSRADMLGGKGAFRIKWPDERDKSILHSVYKKVETEEMFRSIERDSHLFANDKLFENGYTFFAGKKISVPKGAKKAFDDMYASMNKKQSSGEAACADDSAIFHFCNEMLGISEEEITSLMRNIGKKMQTSFVPRAAADESMSVIVINTDGFVTYRQVPVFTLDPPQYNRYCGV